MVPDTVRWQTSGLLHSTNKGKNIKRGKYMKRVELILFFALCICFVGFHTLYAEGIPIHNSTYKEIKNNTFLPLFRALKMGNVDMIKKYISEDMYKKYKTLLEENKDYPNFLRNYYRGIRFRRNKAVQFNNHVIVDLIVEYKNGDRNLTKLQLKKEKDQIWKIDRVVIEKAVR